MKYYLLITVLSIVSVRTASQDTESYEKRWHRQQRQQIAQERIHRVIVQDVQLRHEAEQFTRTNTEPIGVK